MQSLALTIPIGPEWVLPPERSQALTLSTSIPMACLGWKRTAIAYRQHENIKPHEASIFSSNIIPACATPIVASLPAWMSVQPGIKTGSPNRGTSPGAADQLGQATAFKKEQCDTGPALPSKLGNEVALNVGAGGPGKGREVFKSGSQGFHGSAVQGEPRQPGTADRGDRAILGPKGS